MKKSIISLMVIAMMTVGTTNTFAQRLNSGRGDSPRTEMRDNGGRNGHQGMVATGRRGGMDRRGHEMLDGRCYRVMCPGPVVVHEPAPRPVVVVEPEPMPAPVPAPPMPRPHHHVSAAGIVAGAVVGTVIGALLH